MRRSTTRSLDAGLIALAFLLSTTLTPASVAALEIDGRVLDREGGPIAEATVEAAPCPGPLNALRHALAGERDAENPEAPETRTDRDGTFDLELPEPGMWRVLVRASGYLPVAYDLCPLVRSESLPSVRLRSARERTVRVLGADGAPVGNARLRLEPRELRPTSGRPPFVPWSSTLWHPAVIRRKTDDDGRAALPARGPSQLTVTAPGFAPRRLEVRPGNGPLALQLRRGIRRIVEVHDGNGRPVPGVAIAMEGLRFAWTADGQGRLEVRTSSPAETRLRLLVRDGRWAAGTLEARGPEAGGGPPEHIVFDLRPPERWHGRVVDQDSGRHLPGALVWPSPYPSLATRTDPRGRFSLATPFQTEKRIRAAAAGHLATLAELERSTHGEAQVRMQRAGAVRGRITDAAGHPIPRVELLVAPAGVADPDPASALWSRSGPDGAFHVTGLRIDERYWLRTAASGFVPSRTTVRSTRSDEGGSYRVVLEPGISATGRVLDAMHRPVPGAHVLALPSSHARDAESLVAVEETLAEATAAADGRFLLPLMPPGAVDLFVLANGYAPARVRGVELPSPPHAVAEPRTSDGADVDLGTVLLRKGTVVDGWVLRADGQPLGGAEIRVDRMGPSAVWEALGADPGSAVTSSDGSFSIPGLVPGETIHLRVSHRGYLSRSVQLTPEASGSEVTIELKPAARLGGTVRDDDGAPVEGALVFATHPAREQGFGDSRPVGGGDETDAEGRFTLTGLDPGRLRITATAPGYLHAQERVEMDRREILTDLELTLKRGASIEGTVTDASGVPVEGAEVELESNGAEGTLRRVLRPTAVSDRNGAYRLSGVAPGSRTVRARHRDHLPTRRETRVRPGLNSLDLRLRRGVPVSGRVLNGRTEPIASAKVSLVPEENAPSPPSTTSTADGSFRFDSVAPGSYRLLAEHRGYAPNRSRKPFSVAERPVTGVEVTLAPGGSITGRILGLGYDRIQELEITATAAGLPGRRGQLGPRGGYRVSGLAPGEWTVTARSPSLGREASSRTVVEADDDEAILDLEFITGFTLSGRITRNGNPVPGALVASRSASGATCGSVTGGDGRFRIEDLAAGEYVLTVMERAEGGQHTRRLTLDHDRQVSIDLGSSEPTSGESTEAEEKGRP